MKNNKFLSLIIVFLLSAGSYSILHPSWFSNLFRSDISEHNKIDIAQDDDNVIVTMNVPEDIDPDDIRIEIDGKTLYVFGARKTKKEVKNEGYYRSEMISSSFNRMASLPCFVKDESTKAEISGDILIITMPKIKETSLISKKIKIIRTK
jgi:HSP20 family protein